jgi:hypothetical protein
VVERCSENLCSQRPTCWSCCWSCASCCPSRHRCCCWSCCWTMMTSRWPAPPAPPAAGQKTVTRQLHETCHNDVLLLSFRALVLTSATTHRRRMGVRCIGWMLLFHHVLTAARSGRCCPSTRSSLADILGRPRFACRHTCTHHSEDFCTAMQLSSCA